MRLSVIIDSQNDVGGYPNSTTFTGSSAPDDTNHDDMPDEWRKFHGLNPNNASDGSIVSFSADDYTNVELYLNEFAGDSGYLINIDNFVFGKNKVAENSRYNYI